MTTTPHDPTPPDPTPPDPPSDDPTSDDPTPDEHRDEADVERSAPSERDAPSVDPEAPGAALVDPSVEPAEPNEPG